ncbi:FAD dependent oxidoreductase [Stanieria cyanosphaera PCC 7437]|uniref:FAD dependent oxidoreductase n=1 Tax=Stanieria cyanosphaera (strain ATCC 29371 / PCC 7437) TaxID=111780 RepID=K9XZ14_STAC7|nr:FAD-binding oxidoreductase [Stanieria cyanosphaera]AFZ37366.1 FAD dependent oxidoreductase [Stanieria cyanosphaera PCC 7437]
MTIYDWIVIGAGITGSALAYELSKQKFKVLLLEKDVVPNNATVYSYGGLAYWSGTNQLTRQLCQEGIELHRNLSEELEADTEFRELDLVLTIDKEDDPIQILQNYSQFAVTPELLDLQAACELEPLLNPKAIAGILKLPHGHIHPQKTAQAYQQAFLRLGGTIVYEPVIKLLGSEHLIQGVVTSQNTYYAANTVVCAGGLTRSLLKQSDIVVKNYFTHAQLITTPPVDFKLRSIIMPARQQRFALEATASEIEQQSLWDRLDDQPIQSILDAGAVQFLDGSLCIGQISGIITNPNVKFDQSLAEVKIRQQVAKILPFVEKIPGNFHHCLVAFTTNSIAVIGNVKNWSGVYVFNGFTSPLVFVPPLARRFANWVAGKKDQIIVQLNNDCQ